MYMHSFNETLAHYQKLLAAQGEGRLQLENDNLDTGEITEAGVYRPADKSYAMLLEKLDGKPVSDDLRRNILAFYADLEKPFVTKKNPREWKNVLRELDTLKAEEKLRVHARSMPASTTSTDKAKDLSTDPRQAGTG
jgi:hypothetical protein